MNRLIRVLFMLKCKLFISSKFRSRLLYTIPLNTDKQAITNAIRADQHTRKCNGKAAMDVIYEHRDPGQTVSGLPQIHVSKH
jgi:hypothetical protein